jgi:hypothetical protein
MIADPFTIPPHHVELERAVLGALLLEPEQTQAVREWLEPRDFFLARAALLFETIRAVSSAADRVADLLTVSAALPERVGDPGEVLEVRRLAGVCVEEAAIAARLWGMRENSEGSRSSDRSVGSPLRRTARR